MEPFWKFSKTEENMLNLEQCTIYKHDFLMTAKTTIFLAVQLNHKLQLAAVRKQMKKWSCAFQVNVACKTYAIFDQRSITKGKLIIKSDWWRIIPVGPMILPTSRDSEIYSKQSTGEVTCSELTKAQLFVCCRCLSSSQISLPLFKTNIPSTCNH